MNDVTVDHRQLGIDLFNRTWDFLDRDARTTAEDDEMLHCAHASAYHWAQVGTAANRARSEWQCSRVYSVLGRGEPALHHARRCLELVEGSPTEMADWDLAGAYEAMARASLTTGDLDAARRFRALGEEACESISSDGDREHMLGEVRSVPVT